MRLIQFRVIKLMKISIIAVSIFCLLMYLNITHPYKFKSDKTTSIPSITLSDTEDKTIESQFAEDIPEQAIKRRINQQIPVFQFLDVNSSCHPEHIHQPLKSSLYQAALYNDQVYLFSTCNGTHNGLMQLQQENEIWNRVHIINHEPYEDRPDIDEYKKLFLSAKRPGKDDSLWRFELLCIVRWMILYNYMMENNLEQVAFTDSDALVYTNFTLYSDMADLDCALLLDPPRSAGSFGVFNRQCLKEYIALVKEDNIYRSQKKIGKPTNDMALFAKYYFHARVAEMIGQGKEMDLETDCTIKSLMDRCKSKKIEAENFYKSHDAEPLTVLQNINQQKQFPLPLFNPDDIPDSIIETIYDPATNSTLSYSRYYGSFDMNYSGSSFWVRNGEYKQIVWINRYPYVQRSGMDYLIAALGLHFQGRKKSLAAYHIQSSRPDQNTSSCVCTMNIEAKEYCDYCR